ncbi:MAG: hypothetical protein V7L22_34410 [Nostoc sp.]
MLDWLVTITVTAVEIPELTEQEISDKPDALLRLPLAPGAKGRTGVF